jgi:hypothetical protein
MCYNLSDKIEEIILDAQTESSLAQRNPCRREDIHCFRSMLS